MDSDSLPGGWEVWNEEPEGRVILAYRPDVFDTQSFPAACLPTISVAPGSSPDQPPERRARSNTWHVALYLEPMVRVRDVERSFESRSDAVAEAIETARRFAAGSIDYHRVYQVPRDAYVAKLDELTGRDA